MRYLISFLLVLICGALPAQDVLKSTYTYSGDLQLDVYLPQGNSQSDRPLLLFIHGGGFSGGTRDNEAAADFCNEMARQGMVVASISYRLLMKDRGFGCDIPASEKIATFREAARDGARATAYLLSRSDELGFDPAKIILSGSSAGAEAILHLAFWEETRSDSNGEILPGEFSYAGAISLAGAIMDLNLIKHENAIPLMMVHGTCDDLVPYASAPHHYCGYEEPGYLVLNGGGSIAEKYTQIGGSYALYTICGGNHSWASIPLREMHAEAASFIKSYVVEGNHRQLHSWIASSDTCDFPGVMVCKN